MRCEYCGVEQRLVLGTTKTHCAPPFTVQPHAFTGKHPADVFEAGSRDTGMLRAFDTSKLGPVRHDPNSEAARVQVVRDALDALASDSPYLSEMWIALSAREYSHVLLKLARLLK